MWQSLTGYILITSVCFIDVEPSNKQIHVTPKATRVTCISLFQKEQRILSQVLGKHSYFYLRSELAVTIVIHN